MGWLSASVIEQAGKHLLAVLRHEGSVPYSTFYDGSDETHARLCEATGLDDWYGPEGVVDQAAYQLEALGFITIIELDAKLADDETDYRMTLTEGGLAAVEAGVAPNYQSVDL